MVSTDTIQLLLKQRQELRESLIELRRDIATLDASSRTLVDRNMPKPAAAPETSGAALVPATAATAAMPPPFPKGPGRPDGAPVPDSNAAPFPPRPPEPEPEKESEPEVEIPEAEPAPEPEIVSEPAPEPEPEAAPVPEPEPVPDPVADAPVLAAPTDAPDMAQAALMARATRLAAYLAEHPSPVPEAELGALDAAIALSQKATTRQQRDASHQTLQAAYRKVAAASFAASGVTGTTLEDSAAGAPLLWSVPFAISILILIAFPLLLLLRTLAAAMFTADFATDVIWSVGAVAGFLWGAVGALALLALNTALAVFRRRFDGGIRQSPFLRAALGGLTGALIFLALEVWLPMQSAAAEFMLDMAAFAGGLGSTLIFAALQCLISLLTGLVEPANPTPAARRTPKK